MCPYLKYFFSVYYISKCQHFTINVIEQPYHSFFLHIGFYFLTLDTKITHFIYLKKQTIGIMKKTYLFILFLILSAFVHTNADEVSLNNNSSNPTHSYPRTRTSMLIPVTADLSTIDLYLNFISTVGIVDITITDSNNFIVYQKSIDTNTENDLSIPIDNLENGDYCMEITYGSITLVGEFSL